MLNDALNELRAVLLGLCLVLLRYFALNNFFAHIAGEGVCLHGEKVDDAFKVALGTHWKLCANCLLGEAVENGLIGVLKGSAGAVKLIDEADARNVCLVGVAPVGLRLRLNAGNTVKHDDGAVEHAHGALHLCGEVDVSRGVDDVEAVLLRHVLLILLGGLAPETGDGSRGDGDAALALLLHPVGGRLALVHLADFVLRTGVEEHALGRGRLARVNVGNDAEVSHFLQWIISFHE